MIIQKSLTIIGAGAWGSALAIILSDKFDEIFLIDRDKEIMMPFGTICDNQKYIKYYYPFLLLFNR